MKTITILFIIVSLLGACCYPCKTIQPTNSAIEDLQFMTEITKEISDAVDILADDTLSVGERDRLYQKRMKEIDKKVKDREK